MSMNRREALAAMGAAVVGAVVPLPAVTSTVRLSDFWKVTYVDSVLKAEEVLLPNSAGELQPVTVFRVHVRYRNADFEEIELCPA